MVQNQKEIDVQPNTASQSSFKLSLPLELSTVWWSIPTDDDSSYCNFIHPKTFYSITTDFYSESSDVSPQSNPVS